jgi:hypothetical protein
MAASLEMWSSAAASWGDSPIMFGACEFMGEIYTYKGALRHFKEV